MATENICRICGKPVDKKLKYPHPGSPTIDHIIPISRGGHPSDINNLQLAHMSCNRAKANKLMIENRTGKAVVNPGVRYGNIGGKNNTQQGKTTQGTGSGFGYEESPMTAGERNRILPFSIDWEQFRYIDSDDSSNSIELFKQAETIIERGFIITIRGVVPR